jgi:hypothetical protein
MYLDTSGCSTYVNSVFLNFDKFPVFGGHARRITSHLGERSLCKQLHLKTAVVKRRSIIGLRNFGTLSSTCHFFRYVSRLRVKREGCKETMANFLADILPSIRTQLSSHKNMFIFVSAVVTLIVVASKLNVKFSLKTSVFLT